MLLCGRVSSDAARLVLPRAEHVATVSMLQGDLRVYYVAVVQPRQN